MSNHTHHSITNSNHHTIDHVIIGAGLAGISTALHYQSRSDQSTTKSKCCILESQSYVGGKARSEQIDGFTFDVTGHWLHLRDPEMRQLVLDHCGIDHFVSIERKSRVWSHGVYTRYPFQANVYGLPPQVNYECVMGAIEAYEQRQKQGELTLDQEPENFADWVRFYFGEGIAKHFMIPYNAKLWDVSASEITSAWCQRFVPRPQLHDIVAGAVGCHQDGMGYNATFLYPKQGGIQSVALALANGLESTPIHLEHAVTRIDPIKKVIDTHQGTWHYQRLVNTMPLPTLIDCMVNVPDEVLQARTLLRANEVVYLNVGIKGHLGQDDHWIYVPEESWPMYRVGSFSNACSAMAPTGHSSLYIELSDRMTPVDELMPRIVEGLIAMNLIEEAGQVLFAEVRRIPMAYVIYDFEYAQAREVIHQWLATHDILSTGRYGDWNYSSMEDALLDGKKAAHFFKS